MHTDAVQHESDAGIPRPLRRQGEAHVPSPVFATLKRVCDIVLASVGLILVVPLLLVCAGWITLVDPGPVFYRQWRVGCDGWLFRIWKLRTMRLDAERGGARYACTADPRVLPGCAWMRRSHTDELPQLWNVLLGEMSLVGPRPERPEMIEALRPALPGIDHRLAARPGITGLAQVVNGYTNDQAGARRKLACDLLYLRRRSLWGDFKLLLRTATKVWDDAAM